MADFSTIRVQRVSPPGNSLINGLAFPCVRFCLVHRNPKKGSCEISVYCSRVVCRAVTSASKTCTAPFFSGNTGANLEVPPYGGSVLSKIFGCLHARFTPALRVRCGASLRRQWSTSLMLRAVLRCRSSSDSPVHLWYVASLRGCFAFAPLRDAKRPPTR